MADAMLLTSQFAAAGVSLVLAVVLLAVRFNSRVNRAFALYLLLSGLSVLLLAFARLQGAGGVTAALVPYAVLPIPFVLVYFVAAYRSPRRGTGVRIAGLVAVLGTVVVCGIYLADHCTVQCEASVAGPLAGPLFPWYKGVPFAQAIAALVLVAQLPRLQGTAQRPAAAIVAAAFTTLALLEGALVASAFVTEGWGGFTAGFTPGFAIRASRALALIGFALAMVAAALLARALQPRRLPLFASLVGGVLATAAFVAAGGPGLAFATNLSVFLVGLWRLLAGGMVAYALVRHRFLDLDLKISWTISRGTVVAILVATFFIVSQVIENLLDAKLGLVFGGVATGILLVALRPLERLGDRVAAHVHPRGQRAPMLQDERIRLFQEQAIMVWADGVMGRKERLLLDNLRERLGIPLDVAVAVENAAAHAAPHAAPRPAPA